jgi:hypothetical protein
MTLDEVDQKGSQGVDLGVAEAPPQLVLHLPAFGQCPLADAFPGRARVQPLLTAVPAPLRALQETQRDMSSTSRVVACSATPRGSASRDTVGPLGGDRTKHETDDGRMRSPPTVATALTTVATAVRSLSVCAYPTPSSMAPSPPLLIDVALLVLTRAIVTTACGPANLYRPTGAWSPKD